MWLAADFTVERIEDHYPSGIGEVRYDVRWDSERSTYALRHEALDGTVRELTIGDRRLPSTWGTGLIAFPRFPKLLTNVTAESLVYVLSAAFQSRGPEDFAAEQMRVTPLSSGDDARDWQVQLGGYVRTTDSTETANSSTCPRRSTACRVESCRYERLGFSGSNKWPGGEDACGPLWLGAPSEMSRPEPNPA
jgi:hypothetical protein